MAVKTIGPDRSITAWKRERGKGRIKRNFLHFLLYFILIVGAIATAFPFYWMLVLATRTTLEIFNFPPPITFGLAAITNYVNLVNALPFWRNMLNSAFVAFSHTSLVLFFCSIAGFAFAKYDFPGKENLFFLMLATMMIPGMVGIVPWFILMRWFGWINTFKPLIIPGVANAFGIFWMRQYITSFPSEILDAARIDGCPEITLFFRVVVPSLKPAYGALGIMTFMGSWNNFFGPLLVLKDEYKYTLPVALATLRGDATRGYDYGLLMMGTALAMLPILIAFLMAARQFIAGLTVGAIKG